MLWVYEMWKYLQTVPAVQLGPSPSPQPDEVALGDAAFGSFAATVAKMSKDFLYILWIDILIMSTCTLAWYAEPLVRQYLIVIHSPG